VTSPQQVTGSALHASDIRKRFVVPGWLPGRPKATVDALNGIDLVVDPGTIHGVIGPNGSGKSTLLRVLATLVLADGGQASVAGHDVNTDALEVRRAIGFSTGDERSMYWRLTARQNLEFAAALHRLADPDTAIAVSLTVAKLTDAADRPVSGYSQGMVRRLGLARALLHEPRVLLLDEPTRSLDPVAREDFQQVLVGLREHGAVTTLLTTHDLVEAETICDAVSVIRGGRVIANLREADEPALEAALRTAPA
jgi:ABC-2 type transport system ATP-binding protein